MVLKLTVGRPRPGNLLPSLSSTLLPIFYGLDLLDRCRPPAGLSDPPYKLSNWTICTQTDIAIMQDGFRSFPSGHASSTSSFAFKIIAPVCKMHSLQCPLLDLDF